MLCDSMIVVKLKYTSAGSGGVHCDSVIADAVGT